MEFTPDVIVIGAGAAGLAAATKLTRAGINVQILEARERMGGRIFTVSEETQILRSARNGNSKKNDKNSDTITHKPERVAIELGAEFVHGKPREIWDLIGGSTDQVDEIEGTNWCIRERQVGPCEFFDQVNEFLGRMKITPEDMSFADWARTHPDGQRILGVGRSLTSRASTPRTPQRSASIRWYARARRKTGSRATAHFGFAAGIASSRGRCLGCAIPNTCGSA